MMECTSQLEGGGEIHLAFSTLHFEPKFKEMVAADSTLFSSCSSH